MIIGNLKQKAPSALVVFVFACIIITTGLLIVMVKSQVIAENLLPDTVNYIN